MSDPQSRFQDDSAKARQRLGSLIMGDVNLTETQFIGDEDWWAEDITNDFLAATPDPVKLRDWAHALRTTEEIQRTNGNMGRPGCGLCVLGIAHFALSEDEFIPSNWNKHFARLLGCEDDFLNVDSIYRANDSKSMTFSDAAELFEGTADLLAA